MQEDYEASTHCDRVADFSKGLTREMYVMLNAIGVASGPEGMHDDLR